MKFKEIKDATPLSPEDIEGLIPNIATRKELNEFEALNILEAMEWAPRSRKLKKELLTASGLLSLHKKMFGNVWKWAGKFRKSNTSIGVSKELIQSELKVLLDDVRYWQEQKTFPTEEIAIRFHHRLVRIHPFPNGNGRFSRLATDLFLTYQGRAAFSWGGDPSGLRESEELRSEYIRALKKADRDHDHIKDLLKFAQNSG